MRKPTDIQTLYIDFDSFFASVEQQLVPAYRNRPMGVLPLDSPYSGFIAVSREAKALGIKRGARLIDIRKIYPDFPAPVARHDEYIRMHHKILKCVGKTLPIHKTWSIDEVECRLMGCERKDWLRIAVEIRDNLAREIGAYVTPSIGFGANQVLAKIAAEMNKPNGLVCLHPADLPHRLYEIELSDIPGIGRGMKLRLANANIVSVRQLMAMSAKQMRSLWRSVEGERLWAGLHGYEVEKLETVRGMFGHGRILSPDWRNVKGVRNCARMLLVKAARRLRREDFAAGQLSLSVTFKGRAIHGVAQKTHRSVRQSFSVPAIADQTFLNALENLLKTVWQDAPDMAPFQVSVNLFAITPVYERSEDLLETHHARHQRKKWEDITLLLDGLNRHYAKTMISLGTHIEPPGGYTGAKIAFGRIPDMEDFI